MGFHTVDPKIEYDWEKLARSMLHMHTFLEARGPKRKMKKLRAKLALFQFLLFLTVYVRNAICFYELSQNVISLSDEDFQQKVQDSSDLWVIEFFAPW